MLTLRAMDENGKWLPKSKNVYALDESGNRIRTPNGGWKRIKVNTVDWNEQKYGEIWRQDWAAAQNAALEAAGRMERVDMRSLERQGIENRLPQKHLGPTASALERKGICSKHGDENRKIISLNALLASLQKTVQAIGAWLDNLRNAISRQQIIENPDEYPLICEKMSAKGGAAMRRKRALSMTLRTDSKRFLFSPVMRFIRLVSWGNASKQRGKHFLKSKQKQR